jgi:hypothetical protein
VRYIPALALSLLALITVPIAAVNVGSGATFPKNTLILSGDAVGPVHFGEAQNTAAVSLVNLIGKSDGGIRKESQGDCIISAVMYWSDFAVFFSRGKFDGYQTGSYPTNGPVPRFNAATPQGLRVGFTLARAQKLYGSAISTNGAQGGVYAAATHTGMIRGYLSTEPNQAPEATVRLLTLSAGSVGCPAMSPG